MSTIQNMRIVIDATPLLIRSAGVKNYLYYWIHHLRKAAGSETIRTFPDFKIGPLNHERSVAGFWPTWAGLAQVALANYTPVPIMDCAARGADVFHATNLLRRPPRRSCLTTTIHDVTCWLMPELQSASNIRADQNFKETLSRADAAIANSQNTKNDAARVLGIPPEKITVIYPGISDAFFEVLPTAVESIRRRYHLNRPFVLFVGTIEPRKNIDVLLDAYAGLAPSIREEFDLVIAGPIGWAAAETRRRLAQARYLGYIREEDIAALTAAATVLAYPSLYEGFGFPVAQAMAAGVPVVTSGVSSLPEVAGDAALLVDPRSPKELRDALANLLLSPILRAELGKRGRRSAERFRWSNCAQQSLRFFECVRDRPR